MQVLSNRGSSHLTFFLKRSVRNQARCISPRRCARDGANGEPAMAQPLFWVRRRDGARILEEVAEYLGAKKPCREGAF